MHKNPVRRLKGCADPVVGQILSPLPDLRSFTLTCHFYRGHGDVLTHGHTSLTPATMNRWTEWKPQWQPKPSKPAKVRAIGGAQSFFFHEDSTSGPHQLGVVIRGRFWIRVLVFFRHFFSPRHCSKRHTSAALTNDYALPEASPLVFFRREALNGFLTSLSAASVRRLPCFCARLASAPSSQRPPVKATPRGDLRGSPQLPRPTDHTGD